MSWIRRNTFPIAAILVAAAVVIGAFELLDSLTATAPHVAEASVADGLSGIAALAGVAKVTVLMLVGYAITRGVLRVTTRRRRARRAP